MPGYFGDYQGENWWDQYFYPDGGPPILPGLHWVSSDFFTPGLASERLFCPGYGSHDFFTPGRAGGTVVK